MEDNAKIIPTHHVEVGGLYKLHNHLLAKDRVYYGFRFFEKSLTHQNIFFFVLESKKTYSVNNKFTTVKILIDQEIHWVILPTKNNNYSIIYCDTPVEA